MIRGPGGYGSTAAIFAAVLVLTGSVVALLSFTAATPGSAASGRCSGPGYTTVPQAPVGNLTPVILMQPDTVGYVCVTYKAAWADDPGAFAQVVSGSPYISNGSFIPRLYITAGNSLSHSFYVTAVPSVVKPAPDVTRIGVVFRVYAMANSTGIYGGSVPYGYCGSIPMAVGFSAFQLNKSDFPVRPPPFSCLIEPYAPVSVGVVGMGVALEAIASSRLYLMGGSGCFQSGPGYTGGVPCFTYEKSNASVFNCLAEAATSVGCTKDFAGYKVTVWFPDTNRNETWADCAYAVTNLSGQKLAPVFQDCVPYNETAFLVAAQPDPLG